MKLYLDVDGVVNPRPARQPGPFDDWVNDGYVTWSPSMGERLAGLGAEIVWLSTWRDQANDILSRRYGWEPKEVLERHEEVVWWKIESLFYNHDGEPFIWVDDEIDERRSEDATVIDGMLAGLGVEYLLICPDPHVGISAEQFEEMATFIAQNGAADASDTTGVESDGEGRRGL